MLSLKEKKWLFYGKHDGTVLLAIKKGGLLFVLKKQKKKNSEEKEKKRLFQSTNKWKKQSNRVKSLMEFMKSVIKDVGSLSCWL